MATSTDTAIFDTVSNVEGKQFEPGRYQLKVVRLEAATGQFGPQIKWIMNVSEKSDDGWALHYDNDGQPYEWHQYTSTKLSPKTKGRKWAQAFLGRDLEDGESGAEIARALVGCKANAILGPNERGYSAILQIDPAPKPKKAPKPPVEDDEDDE